MSSVVLQFAGPRGLPPPPAVVIRTIMISIMMRAATSAIRLHMIVIRVASTATGAVFKETRSFSTEHSLHRWSGRVFSTTTGRVAHHRFSITPYEQRLTTLRP